MEESRFQMWRAVVAMVHADGVVTPHEVDFINTFLRDKDMAPDQWDIIKHDLQTPQDIVKIFERITSPDDRKAFFSLARALAWCDGDYDAQERMIVDKLVKLQREEDKALLKESIKELALCRNQWKQADPPQGHVLDFLRICNLPELQKMPLGRQAGERHG